MRSHVLATLCVLVLAGSAGCDINTDPAVFVDASATDPEVAVALKGALGAGITGGFTLKLHLGARASGSSEVGLEGFDLVSEDEKTTFVTAIPLSGATFPLTVEQDTDEVVELTIDYGADLATQEEGDALCAAARAKFRGSISDSLRGTSQPVVSDAATVTGCL